MRGVPPSSAALRAAGRRALAQLPGPPGPGVTPIPLDGANRGADHPGGFFHAQAGEVAELDDLGQARVFRLEPRDGLVQGTLILNLVSSAGLDHILSNLPIAGDTYTLVLQPITTVSSIVHTTPATLLTNAGRVTWTVSFAAATLNLTASDFHLTGTANVADSNIGTPATSDGGLTWTVPVGNLGSANGTLTLNVVSSAGLDHYLSNLPIAGDTYTLDHTRPTATITVAKPNLGIGQTSLVTFAFNEVVTDFTNSDLALVDNGTLSPVSSADGGKTWTALFTPAANIIAATNIITLNMSLVHDVLGNAGGNSVSSNNYRIYTQPGSIVFTVTNTNDNVNGTTTNIAALIANPGTDGISLREAVRAANGTFGPVTINFDPTLFATPRRFN